MTTAVEHDLLAYCINPTCRRPVAHVLADCENPDCQQAWQELLAAVDAAVEDGGADALASYDQIAAIKRQEGA